MNEYLKLFVFMDDESESDSQMAAPIASCHRLLNALIDDVRVFMLSGDG